MYTYPEMLNACQRVAVDLFTRAHAVDPVRFPFSAKQVTVTVVADSMTGTASVDWNPTALGMSWQHLYVTINLPVKTAGYVVTEAEFQHTVAYLLHECGHPWHTDKRVWKAAVARQAHNLLNSLEDVREEKATIDLGLAVNATKMFGSLIDSLHAKAVAEGYDPNNTRSIGWTLSTLGRQANGYDMDVSDIARRLNLRGVVGRIVEWALPELAACQSTQDCLDLADKVTDAVRKAKKVEPEPEVIEIPEGNGASGAGEFQPQGAGGEQEPEPQPEPEAEEAKAEDEPKAEPQGESQSEGEVADNTGSGSGQGQKEPQPEKEQTPDEMFDATDMTPNKAESLTSASGRGYEVQKAVIKEVRKALERSLNDKPIVGRSTRTYSGGMTVDIVAGDASKMGRQRSLLAQALKREETDDYEGGRLSGRLDRRAMSRLVTGNPHVFGKRILAEGYDTDVQILIDGSSSMEGNRILAASTLGLVVAQAAAQVGVECNAHVFNNELHAITKGRAKPVGRKFAYACNQARGCTPLTHNMLTVAMEQKRRAPNKRRILFLITDGGCDLGPEVLKGAGKYVEDVMGTEIANLHIGNRAMGLFRNECAVNTFDVAKAGMKTLTSVLERGVR